MTDRAILSQIESLKEAEYLSLSTFRKNGKEVPTVVWAAFTMGAFYVFSEEKAGKVKRLNNSSQASLATCTVKGDITGPKLAAEGTIITDLKEIESAYTALREKYTWKMFLLDSLSRLSGRYYKRAMLRMELPLLKA